MQQNVSVQQQIPQQQSQNNIILKTNDVISQSNNQLPNPPIQTNNPENTIQNNNPNYNELVNQLQEASRTGATTLPSRDIPMDSTQVKNDVEVKPNYIPEPKIQEDYIKI